MPEPVESAAEVAAYTVALAVAACTVARAVAGPEPELVLGLGQGPVVQLAAAGTVAVELGTLLRSQLELAAPSIEKIVHIVGEVVLGLARSW